MVAALILLVAPLCSCPAPSTNATPDSPPVPMPNQRPTGSFLTHESLTGTVIVKKVTKDLESWHATEDGFCGTMKLEEYLVLDTGGTPPKERSAAEGVIIRGCDGVHDIALHERVGKRLHIYGDYEYGHGCEGRGDSPTPYPKGQDGKPLSRGIHFRGCYIEGVY